MAVDANLQLSKESGVDRSALGVRGHLYKTSVPGITTYSDGPQEGEILGACEDRLRVQSYR